MFIGFNLDFIRKCNECNNPVLKNGSEFVQLLKLDLKYVPRDLVEAWCITFSQN